MKTEDCTKENIDICQPENSEKQMGRREALNKVALTALSTATMMVLMKSAHAAGMSTNMPTAPTAVPPPTGSTWQRTTRT